MPSYVPSVIEPKWQQFWLENQTFRAADNDPRPKHYILDMFPYPSSDGLHIGHPEGYTATDILARYQRMRGKNVLHPMGWDAFGLPAEQYAVKTNTHPAVTTRNNIQNFRRQIQSLGFSYDWSREVDTTDPGYYRWTQWIFLRLFHSWYDAAAGKARHIDELPIPDEVARRGDLAIRRYQDSRRLAYMAEVPVNWCAALGTVLANEEVVNGRSERGNHPVVRIPLRQWMLRITAYAERLLADLDQVDWPEPIKEMQRNWIGKSEGAEVDFPILPAEPVAGEIEQWFAARARTGFPDQPGSDVIRVFTTRPDTLFGATYMVLAPEHPLVDRITPPDRREVVAEYKMQAASKSDLDRTDLARQKSGVFTGAYAVNPTNGEPIPIWIADYVLMGYGTGAIMAVPAHDERDFEFAQKYGLDIVEVVADPAETPNLLKKAYEWVGEWERRPQKPEGYLRVALLLNCGFDIESFESDLEESRIDPLWREVRWFYDPDEGKGLAIAYLDPGFEEILAEYVEEQEDTQILVLTLDPELEDDFDEDDEDAEAADESESTCDHEGPECEHMTRPYTAPGIAMSSGLITGLPTAEAKTTITRWLSGRGLGRSAVHTKLRDWLFSRQRYWGEPFPILFDEAGLPVAVPDSELPVLLPELSDFRPTGTPEPPLAKATEWVNVVRDGKRYRRETNTMPQWAGSCWYYLRYLDPANTAAGWDAAKEKYWMPVDLYVGGAEHAVLHLLYSRFWHKVLHDLGYVHCPEPFRRLVNQGMILGEPEEFGWQLDGRWLAPTDPGYGGEAPDASGQVAQPVRLAPEETEERAGKRYIRGTSIEPEVRAFKMSKSRGNVVNPDAIISQYGADSLRLYEMFLGPLEATKPWSTKGVEGVWRFLNRAWRIVVDVDSPNLALHPAVQDVPPEPAQWRALHQAIRGVTQDIDAMRFNTAISKLMELVNFLTPLTVRPRALIEPFVLLLSPFAPHLAEECWQALGHSSSLAYEPWPTFDPAFLVAETVEVVFQVNSKVRGKFEVPAGLGDSDILAAAKQDSRCATWLNGKKIVKELVVTSRGGKLVNFVVK